MKLPFLLVFTLILVQTSAKPPHEKRHKRKDHDHIDKKAENKGSLPPNGPPEFELLPTPLESSNKNPEETTPHKTTLQRSGVSSRNANRSVKRECGVQYVSDRIVGGEDAGIDEFPWLALLFYDTKKGLKYKCGGTLVGQRTIVTAAHCLEGQLRDAFQFVRLGEWNAAEEEDCNEDDCADPPIDFKAKEFIIHPDRVAGKNDDDLALIVLEEEPPYTDFIRPICLPYGPFAAPANSSQALIVGGWGSTTQYITLVSDVKQKLRIDHVPFDECKAVFQNLTVTLDENKMICAGGKRKQGTCAGDSGGPLMFFNRMKSYLAGVVSFGTKPCAEVGIPGVFVNVWNYMDWIKDNSI